MRLRIHELYFVMEIRRVGIVEREVQHTYGIDTAQAVIPIAFLGLVTDWEGAVEYAPVLEELLLCLLHLNEDALACYRLAIDIEYSLAFCFCRAELFGIQICKVCNFLMTLQQGIQETDEQILIHFRPEQFLEGKVSIEVDISFS